MILVELHGPGSQALSATLGKKVKNACARV